MGTRKYTIIDNVDNVNNSQNEYMMRFAFNRNVRKLLQNDIKLYQKISTVSNGKIIDDFQQSKTYESGDLIWFLDSLKRLWLLRKIVNYTGKTDNPNDAVSDNPKNPNFEEHGWKDENEKLDVFKYDIDTKLKKLVKSNMNKHESDLEKHVYGSLQTDQDMRHKFLLGDISNVQIDRSTTFYPFKTVRLDPSDVILNGYVRIWDCGLLEYDINYRFGYRGVDQDGYTILTCNDVQFQIYKNRDNIKYFNSSDDAAIFCPQNDAEINYSIIEDTKQCNRNDYVNTYFARVDFPRQFFTIDGEQKQIQFGSSDYMIFSSNIMSHDRNLKDCCVNSSANNITFCDRSTNGFTALLVTFPDNSHFGNQHVGYNTRNGGLVSNSFHCHIVGKWIITG